MVVDTLSKPSGWLCIVVDVISVLGVYGDPSCTCPRVSVASWLPLNLPSTDVGLLLLTDVVNRSISCEAVSAGL